MKVEFKERLGAVNEMHKRKVEEVTRLAEDTVKEKDDRIQQLQEQLRAELGLDTVPLSGTPSDKDPSGPTPLPTQTQTNTQISTLLSTQGFNSLSITEMYDRVVQLERALGMEKARRREADLYLNRVLQDVESKAPVIAAQRKDYHRVLKSHEALSQRLAEAGEELDELQRTVVQLQNRVTTAESEAKALQLENKDLCAQLQHILRSNLEQQLGTSLPTGSRARAGDRDTDTSRGASAADVISDYLVTYNDVTELQTRNIQLLKVVRKLSSEQEQEQEVARRMHLSTVEPETDAGQMGSGDNASERALREALRELEEMRSARLRTEEAVVALVQQRDLQKAMLEEADRTIASLRAGGGGGGEMVTYGSSSPSPRTPGSVGSGALVVTTPSNKIQDVMQQLEQARIYYLSSIHSLLCSDMLSLASDVGISTISR